MENASKALLIAGGVLIAVLIITLFVSVLQSTGKVSKQYNQSISSEQVTTFNSNFTQYMGKDLTIHDVITICNFADGNNTKKVNVVNGKSVSDIDDTTLNKKYKIIINTYDENGYISQISFN